MKIKANSNLLAAFSLALTLGTCDASAGSKDYWILNGDPMVAEANPGKGFGYVTKSLPDTKLSNSWVFLDPKVAKGIRPSKQKGYASTRYTDDQKRGVAIYATMTDALYQEAEGWSEIKRLNPRGPVHKAVKEFQKVYDVNPIKIFPDQVEAEANAWYSDGDDGVDSFFQFCHFTPDDASDGGLMSVGESSDIITHELGHSRFARLRRKADKLSTVEDTPMAMQGYNEGLGDMYSLAYSVATPSQRRLAFEQAGGWDLNAAPNVLGEMGEQFGKGLGDDDGLRNLATDVVLTPGLDEEHDIGQVWASGNFDLMNAISGSIGTRLYSISMTREEEYAMRDAALVMAGQYMLRANLLATLMVAEPDPTIGHFSTELRKIAETKIPLVEGLPIDPRNIGDMVKRHFEEVRHIPTNGFGNGGLNVPTEGKAACSKIKRAIKESSSMSCVGSSMSISDDSDSDT